MQKNKKYAKKEETPVITSNEISSLLKIVVIVIIIFLAFYLITYLLKGNANYQYNNPNGDEAVVIGYDEIMAGTVLNQSDKEYYVLAYHNEDPYLSLYKSYIETYKAKSNSLNTYYIDLENGYNKSYIGEKSNLNTDIVKDIRFKQTTLLKIKDKKIVNTYEKQIDIEKYLKNIAE